MASRGRPPHPDILTPAEWRVADLVRHGLGPTRIARHQGVSRDAVRYHLENITAKLGLAGRHELRQWRGIAAGSPVERSLPEMTDTFALGPIGQIALTVDSLETAVPFYRDTLGLRHLYTFGNLAFFDCQGTRLFLTAASDEDHSRNHSVIYFQVPDINHAYDRLSGRGVGFEGAPHMIHRHEDGTEEWMAFFKDPSGNILAIMGQARP